MAKQFDGRTSLMIAADESNFNVMVLLLQLGSNVGKKDVRIRVLLSSYPVLTLAVEYFPGSRRACWFIL